MIALPSRTSVMLSLALSVFAAPLWAQEAPSDADMKLVQSQSKALAAVINKVNPAFIFIGGGSGVIISPDGYMLTNNHVAQGKQTWSVFSPGGRRHVAKVVGIDSRGDLTLLKLEGKGPFPYVELGNSDEAKAGDTVFAVGNPIGIGYEDYSPTFTQGIISVVNRNHANYTDCVQTDAPINPGNSGGLGCGSWCPCPGP